MTASPRLRIATWNLERPLASERSRRERLLAWIREIRADIWVLTETRSDFSPGPEYSGDFTRHADRAQESGEAWTAVWSRFPVQPITTSADPARVVAIRTEPPHRRPLIVYGTVLPWLGSPWRDAPAPNGCAFAAALTAQRDEWARLQRLYPDCDLVVAGDLNQDLAPKHYYGSRANSAALVDALTATDLECLTGGAGDPVYASTLGRRACIDHVCATRALAGRCRGPAVVWPHAAAPPKDLSDHFGVAVDFDGA